MADSEPIDAREFGGSSICEKILTKAEKLQQGLNDHGLSDADISGKMIVALEGKTSKSGNMYSISSAVDSVISDRDPMGDGLDDVAQKLSAALKKLGASDPKEGIVGEGPGDVPAHTISEYVGQARKKVFDEAEWTGDSATAFENDFSDYYTCSGDSVGQALILQWAILFALQSGVEAIQEVRACARRDIDRLLDKAITALDGEDEDKWTSDGIGGALTVVAALATVAVAVSVPGVGTLGVVAAYSTAISQAYNGVNTVAKQNIAVPASDPGATAEFVGKTLAEIKQVLTDGEDAAGKSMTDAVGKSHKSGKPSKKYTGPKLTGKDGKSPLTGSGEVDNGYSGGFEESD